MAGLDRPTSDFFQRGLPVTFKPFLVWRGGHANPGMRKLLKNITNKVSEKRGILNLVGRRLKVSLASLLDPPASGRLGVSSAPGQAYRSRWAEGHVCDKARRTRYTSTPFASTLRDETGVRVRASL
jgi:hypothetical protein